MQFWIWYEVAVDILQVHEAAAVCSALTRAGKTPVFYAPSQTHYDEVNHQNADPTNETDRNVLVESARIARGKVQSISVSISTKDVRRIF